MSYQEDKFTEIANAIREKKGTSALISANNFASEISSIETGITPTGDINITQNGNYDVTEKAQAIVNVQPQGTKTTMLVTFTDDTTAEYDVWEQDNELG